MNTIKLGQYGERIAAAYVTKKGYYVIGRNIRLGHLEIDLVATKGTAHTLFEVKTKLAGRSGDDQVLTRQKIARLKRALLIYAELNELDPDSVDIDLLEVSIDANNKMANIKHYSSIS